MELKNMVIKEVSLVDKPANKRKFLLYKRDAGGGNVKLTLEAIQKMNEADLRKRLEDSVKNQEAFDTLVSEFESKVTKAAEDHGKKETDLEKRESDAKVKEDAVEKRSKEVEARERAVAKADPEMQCADCGAVFGKSEMKEGKCPKCGSANVAEVKVTKEAVEKAVKLAVAKVTVDLTKSNADVQARDQVIEELVSAVDTLKKSTVSKSEVQVLVKEAVAEFRKTIR